MVHNETLNIWTHLLAAIVVVLVLGYFLWVYTPDTSKDSLKLQIKNKFDSYVDKLNIVGISMNANNKLAEINQALKYKYEELSNLTG